MKKVDFFQDEENPNFFQPRISKRNLFNNHPTIFLNHEERLEIGRYGPGIVLCILEC